MTTFNNEINRIFKEMSRSFGSVDDIFEALQVHLQDHHTLQSSLAALSQIQGHVHRNLKYVLQLVSPKEKLELPEI